MLEIENYYKTLYSSKVDVTEEQLNRYIEHLEIPYLSHEVSEKADGLLTLEDCKTRRLKAIPWDGLGFLSVALE